MEISKAKVLFLDVERAPSLGWVWGKWEQDVIDFKQDWYFLSFAWKWQGQTTVNVCSLPDFAHYTRNKENDIHLVKALWNLYDKADIIVAHNGDKADFPWSRTRFIALGFPPPSPFRTIDTCKIAKRQFKFDSNKLDELGRYLGLGRKLPNTGFDLWKRCMEGDAKAWATMCDYNKQDVALLEQVYLKMRCWDTQHPPLQGGFELCPKCSSTHVTRQGFKLNAQSRRQQFQCQDCAGWFLGKAEKVA